MWTFFFILGIKSGNEVESFCINLKNLRFTSLKVLNVQKDCTG
jgi:hypothetical protein